MGKVKFLTGKRDFNTGMVWHKADVCSLAETRSKVSHWTSGGKSSGGKKFAEEFSSATVQ